MSRGEQTKRRRILVAGIIALGVVAAGAGAQFANASTTPKASTKAAASQTVNATIKVSGTFDGANKVFVAGKALGNGDQSENQKPVFELAAGSTLSNVTIGVPGADGVHCLGSCTLKNINWQDVGEDAATFLGSNATVVVDGGSAAKGTDKVFQDNRLAGGSVTIRNFKVSAFGKLYRSCGNCKKQSGRTAVIQNITATAPGKVIAGINPNLGDKVTLSNITITGSGAAKVHTCELFKGNSTGAEPTKVGTAPDGKACVATGVAAK